MQAIEILDISLINSFMEGEFRKNVKVGTMRVFQIDIFNLRNFRKNISVITLPPARPTMNYGESYYMVVPENDNCGNASKALINNACEIC